MTDNTEWRPEDRARVARMMDTIEAPEGTEWVLDAAASGWRARLFWMKPRVGQVGFVYADGTWVVDNPRNLCEFYSSGAPIPVAEDDDERVLAGARMFLFVARAYGVLG